MERKKASKKEKIKPIKIDKILNKPFSSEILLQQAIAGLLQRMPDVTGVQILQGTQELGKDLIFYIRGGFGETVLCACVVKNTKITGDAGKSEGARTVYLQAQQAFDSPHIDESGKDVFVERVYIVTPFDLSPAMIGSIKGKLRERSGQIVFVGGSSLFDLFKKFWPDYLADEAAAIEYHLSKTRKQFEDDNPLFGLVSHFKLGNIKMSEKKIYVPQSFYRDLYSYQMGPVLTKALPSERNLMMALSMDDLKRFDADLRKYNAALKFLQEWGYCFNNRKLDNIKHIEIMIKKLNHSLESEWQKTVKRVFGNQFSFEKASVALDNYQEPKAILLTLFEQHKIVLAPLEKALIHLKQVVDSSKFSDIRALANKSFVSSCILNHCAHTAPDGIFEPKNKLRVEFPKNILDKRDGHLLIVGAPGYGKTSFCRWHALQDTERFNSGQSNVVPVYVPLHKLARRNSSSFEETFLKTLGQSALIEESARIRTALDGKIRLYLDGLDEIASDATRRHVVELVQSGVNSNSKYQIVLTSRDHIYGTYLNWLPRVALGGFDAGDLSTGQKLNNLSKCKLLSRARQIA